MKIHRLFSSLFIGLTISAGSIADIETLSQDELTDTYIKDTTVLVKQKEAEPEPVATATVQLKVSPIEKEAQVLPQDPIHNLDPISNEMQSYEYLNQNAALANGAIPNVQIPMTLTDQQAAMRDEFIRSKLNLAPNEPIDPSALSFNYDGYFDDRQKVLNNGQTGNLPTVSANSITFTIPNSMGAATQQHTSPNGEVSVNVTPSKIEYILTAPR